MQHPLYDYKDAYERIQELRRRVILQKDGQCVDGLTEIALENDAAKRVTKKKTNSQENNR